MDIPGLADLIPNDDHRATIQRLGQSIDSHRASNKVKSDYYDMQARWHDLGIAVPQRFKTIQVASGWPAKAVDHLARRIRFESFTMPGRNAIEAMDITSLWDDNYMELDFPQLVVSTLIHSPGFIATTLGDPDAGDPPVVFSTYDALHATGEWNWSRRGLDTALLYAEENDEAIPVTGDTTTVSGGVVRMLFFVDDQMYEIRRTRTGGTYTQYSNDWAVDRQDVNLGRVPVEVLLYHPRTSRRPFGGSRITRAVRYLTQAAMRTMVRMELGAEFYSNIQRYALNVNEEDLMADGRTEWDVMVGRMLTLGASEDPDSPDPIVGQFPQITMQPHVDMWRLLATAMSGETGIPVGSLGIIQDNPSSAEAIYANKEDLTLEAEEATRFFTPALKRTIINGIQMRDNLSDPPAELRKLGARWIDPSTPSRSQATDAVMKQVEGGVLPADSEVTLELLGHSPDVIRRVAEDRRLAAARETVRAAIARQAGQAPVPAPGDAPEAPGVPAQGTPAVAPPQQQSVGDFRDRNNLPS